MNPLTHVPDLSPLARKAGIGGVCVFVPIACAGMWFAGEGLFLPTLLCGAFGLLLLFIVGWAVHYHYAYEDNRHYLVVMLAGGYVGALVVFFLTGGV